MVLFLKYNDDTVKFSKRNKTSYGNEITIDQWGKMS